MVFSRGRLTNKNLLLLLGNIKTFRCKVSKRGVETMKFIIDGEELDIRIKHLREAAGLSKVQLSKLSNVSRSYISELEHGKYAPSIIVLKKLAKALNCSVSELILMRGIDYE